MNRRRFLACGAWAGWGLAFPGFSLGLGRGDTDFPFRISLAEWSLVRTIQAGKMTNLDFPRVARRQFGIDTIEFVDQFFADKVGDRHYLDQLKQHARDEGVAMGLIMIDTNGPLGAAGKAERDQAVEKTFAWIDCARHLGCRTVRINASGPQDPDDLRGRIVESCIRLADHAADRQINVIIENHGGLSSDPDWLVSVMKAVNKPNFGTLPDFGNFPPAIDRYDAVEKLMPFAKAVSAKASSFTADGLCKETDYFRMLRIVLDRGYKGHIGIESGGANPDGEAEAVRLTRRLLEHIFEQQKRRLSIFNGRDMEGWVHMGGGEWSIEEGAMVGQAGRNWSNNPDRAGTWLRSKRQYADFRLELQFQINEGGNSGIFFRSAREANPAYTGYEMQIYGSPGSEPSEKGPCSIYDLVAPMKNVVRVGGRWNTVTIIAVGKKVSIEMNGQKTIDTDLSRSLKGHVGLQIHDDDSIVRFRNIRIEQL